MVLKGCIGTVGFIMTAICFYIVDQKKRINKKLFYFLIICCIIVLGGFINFEFVDLYISQKYGSQDVMDSVRALIAIFLFNVIVYYCGSCLLLYDVKDKVMQKVFLSIFTVVVICTTIIQ